MKLPGEFIYGAASSAFQIEGACDIDGKGLSVWDEFSHRKKKISDKSTADIACNHYTLYKDDIRLMKEIGLDSYRFSLSWPRILPEGEGKVNRKGIDFYKKLVDSLLENDIEPFITVFHWDLPLALQKKYKGFENRQMSSIFGDFVEIAVKELGDRVSNWITINEPFEYSCFGHFLGSHAPGRKSLWAYFRVMHNLLRAHGIGMKIIKDLLPRSNCGITVSMTPIHPKSDSQKDNWSAMIANQFINHITLSPLFKGEYPRELWKQMKFFQPEIEDGDMELISEPADFIGLNVYSREFAVYKWYIPFLKTWLIEESVPEREFVKDNIQYTSMGWEVYPDCIYESLKVIKDEYGNPPVYVTENGAAFTDEVSNGRVADTKRINYLEKHIAKVSQAYNEGSDVRGYFVWSLMDNFEWAEGLSKRFGLIYVDFNNQQRIIKESGYWYRDFIKSQKK
jgi:beta-glucosidase